MILTVLLVVALILAILSLVPGVPGPLVTVAVILICLGLLLANGVSLR